MPDCTSGMKKDGNIGLQKVNSSTPSCTITNPVSLSALEQVQGYLFEVQEKLRDVFINDHPRLELSIFQFIEEVYDKKLKPFLALKRQKNSSNIVYPVEESGDGRNDEQILFEGKYILENAFQDVFAALLFILSKDSVYYLEERKEGSNEADIRETSSPTFEVSLSPYFYSSLCVSCSKSNTSSFYVSRSQRVWCTKVFFFLCWTPDIPLHLILHSLYPLLSRTPTSARGSSSRQQHSLRSSASAPPDSLENHIASNLLDGNHLAWKKQFIMETLNGLLYCRPCSIKSLYKVFILTDRIPLDQGDSIKEVTAYIHPLLMKENGMMWKSENDVKGSSVIRIRLASLAREEQIRIVCTQLVDLFTSHKEEDVAINESDASISIWGAPSGSGSSLSGGMQDSALLPKETLEDRLHLSLVLLLNSLLYLPNKSDRKANASFYQRHYFTNKYFLTPAFASLTLRSASLLDLSTAGDNTEVTKRVVDAIARLCTLIHGTQLGAGTSSLIAVLENAMPGILNLTSMMVLNSPTSHQPSAPALPQAIVRMLNKLWRRLHQDPVAVDFVAEVAVRACFPCTKPSAGRVSCTLAIQKNCIEGPSIRVDPLPCLACTFLDGLFKGILSPFFLQDGPPSKEESMNSISDLLQSKTILSFARYCSSLQQSLQMEMTSSKSTESESPSSKEELNAATDFLVCYLIDASASSLFTHEPSLPYVFEVLCTVLPLSAQCFSWSVVLAVQILESLSLKRGRKQEEQYSKFMSLPSLKSEKNALKRQMEKFKLLVQKHSSEMLEYSSISFLSRKNAKNMPVSVALSLLLDEGLLDEVLQRCCRTGNIGCGGKNEGHAESLIDKDEASPLSTVYITSSLHDHQQAIVSALHRESVSELSVKLVELARFVEECSFRGLPAETSADIQKNGGEAVVAALFQVLGTTTDTFSAVNAIQILCCIGMYRWDAPNTEVLAKSIWESLLLPLSSLSSSSPFFQRSVGMYGFSLPPAERFGTFKARLLDLLLSWCDYDQEGLTLRHIDSYGQTMHSCSLMELLAFLCKPDQPDVVQVAAMHCIGPYFLAVYPRVSLWRLCQLSQDVFRSTPIEMAKAACAAMLHHVVAFLVCSGKNTGDFKNLPRCGSRICGDANFEETLCHRVSLVLNDEKELKMIQQIAMAMSSYYSNSLRCSTFEVSPTVRKEDGSLGLSHTIKIPLNAEGNKKDKNSFSAKSGNLSELPPCPSDDHRAVIRQHGKGILDALSLLKKDVVTPVVT